MRVLWSIHLYPPKHNCGAEYVAHNVNRYLISKGHQVRVLLHYGEKCYYNYEGVEVMGRVEGVEPYYWPDVVLTHLDFTRHTINVCQVAKRPVVHFMHNSAVDHYSFIKNSLHSQYMVYNSNWVAKEFNFPFKSMVLYPPCPAKAYQIPGLQPEKSKYVTLINTNENKGGWQLYRLAQIMPDQQFLAIEGSYDDGGLQGDILELLRTCPNVTLQPHGPDIKAVYQQTRILLVPSRYESWGRVATEAIINGIPVLAAPTAGLLENLDHAGIFLPARGPKRLNRYGDVIGHDGDTYPVERIKQEIERLQSPTNYSKASEKSIERAIELEYYQETQLNTLENFFYEVQQDFVSKYYGNGPGH
jgi:glycosyltransferase involved in cell wall biosynthesis